jgi:hypothetical protein
MAGAERHDGVASLDGHIRRGQESIDRARRGKLAEVGAVLGRRVVRVRQPLTDPGLGIARASARMAAIEQDHHAVLAATSPNRTALPVRAAERDPPRSAD